MKSDFTLRMLTLNIRNAIEANKEKNMLIDIIWYSNKRFCIIRFLKIAQSIPFLQ